jgi:hypothetical protein
MDSIYFVYLLPVLGFVCLIYVIYNTFKGLI